MYLTLAKLAAASAAAFLVVENFYRIELQWKWWAVENFLEKPEKCLAKVLVFFGKIHYT